MIVHVVCVNARFCAEEDDDAVWPYLLRDALAARCKLCEPRSLVEDRRRRRDANHRRGFFSLACRRSRRENGRGNEERDESYDGYQLAMCAADIHWLSLLTRATQDLRQACARTKNRPAFFVDNIT